MSRRRTVLKPTDYIFRFAEELAKQLESDFERYGDKWREVSPDELPEAIYERLERYWVEFSRDGLPLPWLKIAGLALIGWIRTNYPKTYVNPD